MPASPRRRIAGSAAVVAAVTMLVIPACSGGGDDTDDTTTTTVFVPITPPDLRDTQPRPSPYEDNDAMGDPVRSGRS